MICSSFRRQSKASLPIEGIHESRPVDALLHQGEAQGVADRGGKTFARVSPIEVGSEASFQFKGALHQELVTTDNLPSPQGLTFRQNELSATHSLGERIQTKMRYFFYPFNDDWGLNEMFKLALPNMNPDNPNPATSPKIGRIICEDGSCPDNLSAVVAGDEIFIIGHGASETKKLGSQAMEVIDQTEIVARLVQVGLPKHANCMIVIYACNSGVGEENSLAGKVAYALRTGEFNPCFNNVYGFTYEMSMRRHDGNLCCNVKKDQLDKTKNLIDYKTMYFSLKNIPPPPLPLQAQAPRQARAPRRGR